jgi:hypothetical protein
MGTAQIPNPLFDGYFQPFLPENARPYYDFALLPVLFCLRFPTRGAFRALRVFRVFRAFQYAKKIGSPPGATLVVVRGDGGFF